MTVYDLTEREMLIYRDMMEERRKSEIATWLLWLLLGVLGGYRYYLGHVGYAIAMTLTLGGLGIWTLVDGFLIPKALRENASATRLDVLRDISLMRRWRAGE